MRACSSHARDDRSGSHGDAPRAARPAAATLQGLEARAMDQHNRRPGSVARREVRRHAASCPAPSIMRPCGGWARSISNAAGLRAPARETPAPQPRPAIIIHNVAEDLYRRRSATAQKPGWFRGQRLGFSRRVTGIFTQPSSYSRHPPLSARGKHYRGCGCYANSPHNPQEPGLRFSEFKPHARIRIFDDFRNVQKWPSTRSLASCDGDLRGALKALLLVNEQLEARLAGSLCDSP